MPQTPSHKLDSDDVFPPLTLKRVEGGELTLPSKTWTVLLIYRGYW